MSTPEVRVGDRVRITTSVEGVVNYVNISGSGIELAGIDKYFTLDTQNVEILERAPRVFKVGDKVDVLDFELLPQGTILVDKDEAIGTPRFVDAGRKKIIIDSTDMFPFSFYLESRNVGYNFVVAYIPGGEK